LVVAGILALSLAAAMLFVLFELPFERRLLEFDKSALVLEDADGSPSGHVGAWIENPTEIADLPDHLVAAVLSVEDRRFYSHWGIDPLGIARAARANAEAGSIVAGGSTITQQLVKALIVGNERTLGRKFHEALLAIWLELRLGKDEILKRYLNSVYLGAGAYGMPAAAKRLFGKSVQDLSLAESAMLAGLIKAPSRNHPVRNPRAARQRAETALDAMVSTGAITQKQAQKAKEGLALVKLTAERPTTGPWFNDWIAHHEFPKLGGREARKMRVRTTMDHGLQSLAERVVRDVLDKSGDKLNARQAALVAMRPDGAVLAMVGGRDYDKNRFNRAVDAKRQPGSAFKIFVYLAALRQGYAADSLIDASGVQISDWRPENYGGASFGQMSVRRAFANSVNTAAARLASDVGLDRVIAAARDLGIRSPLSEFPSMALGSMEVSLLELTGAMASIKNGRYPIQPWGIGAFGPDGGALRRLEAPRPEHRLRLQGEMTELMQEVVANGTGRAVQRIPDAAGKTGTSQDYRDAWFVGFGRELVVGVWVGNDNGESMKSVTGGSLPAVIWREFMASVREMPKEGAGAPAGVDAEGVDPEPDSQVAADPNASCNIEACSAAYDSFRASDCTYQPYDGPRRLCGLGVKPGGGEVALFSRAPQGDGSIEGQDPPPWCDVATCSGTYRSFRASDCTYQPYGGASRRLCMR
jgi:1A family penicillin-binding protein